MGYKQVYAPGCAIMIKLHRDGLFFPLVRVPTLGIEPKTLKGLELTPWIMEVA